MILISHRGNTNGKILEAENHPEYINDTICLGYEVEIDMWWFNDKIYLGHDKPQYEVNDKWLEERIDKLWIHCKNVELLNWIRNTSLHYFWHEADTITLTSKNYIWAYPGKQPIIGSIAVMPELNQESVFGCIGVCSDFIENYKNKLYENYL
jgi:hypothetical protein